MPSLIKPTPNKPITVVTGGNTYNASFTADGRNGYIVRNVNNNTFIGLIVAYDGVHAFQLSAGPLLQFKVTKNASSMDLVKQALDEYVKWKLSE